MKQVLYPVDNCKGRYISTCGIATDIFTVHCRHPVFLHFPVCGVITIPASVTNPYSKGERNKLSKEGFFFSVEDPKHFNAGQDPDPAFHFNMDQDPAFHFNLGPEPGPAKHQSESTLRL